MTFWQHILNRLRAVPAGIWAALAVAGTMLGLYLRGKRLQAELAKARLDTEVAKAASAGAQDEGKAIAHLDEARMHADKARDIAATLRRIEDQGEAEQKRIQAMPHTEVTNAYLEMLRKQKPGA